jgi:hypothetical protein
LVVAFSPDWQTLASAGGIEDRTVGLWDVKTGQAKATLQGHTHGVSSVAFSPDGHTLASGSLDKTVRFWDVRTGQPTVTLPHTAWVLCVAFSPDGATLASGSGGYDVQAKRLILEVRLWDVKTGQLRATLPHRAVVRSVAYSGDGRRVFCWDAEGNVCAWAVSDGQPAEPAELPAFASPQRLTSPDGTLRAEAQEKAVVLLDLALVERDRADRIALEPVNRVFWHQQHATHAEHDQDWFAAAFHLGQLLKDKPDDADLLRRRDLALEKLKPPNPMVPLLPP